LVGKTDNAKPSTPASGSAPFHELIQVYGITHVYFRDFLLPRWANLSRIKRQGKLCGRAVQGCNKAYENQNRKKEMVPHAGIEPALLSELDFESSASTSSANGARGSLR
jgi:hypothetical protein